jgi:hypothetical protein
VDQDTQTALNNLKSDDKNRQNDAFQYLTGQTQKPVDWAYQVWDEIAAILKDKDNRRRAIAAQVLCNLAKSDPEKRILEDIDALFVVTKDERFVTARHCMQSLWKVGVEGAEQQKRVVEGLTRRFEECMAEKNGTLIRYDIIEAFRNLYDAVKDEAIKQKALALIETEQDPKYRKKYAGLWKKA